MAESVKVQNGDTVSKILTTKRGHTFNEIGIWQRTLALLNPHISHLDRIYPGDSILIPDTLYEDIPRQMIWRHAFSNIPLALKNFRPDATSIYFVQFGDDIDTVSQYMFSSGPYRTMSPSSKRALLIHNNPYLERHLNTKQLPNGMLLNITPALLSEFENKHWMLERTPLQACLDQMQNDMRDMFQIVEPEPTVTMAQMVAYLKSIGAAVGTDDIIKAAGYGVGGVSGHAAAGTMALNNINALARDIYSEAVEKLGVNTVHSKKASHLARIQQFLKGHPKYAQLMRHLTELPQHVLPKGTLTPAAGQSHVAVARHFRKHFSLPLKKWNNASKYVGSAAKQLNGRLSVFKTVGRHATWYVPATLGIISVASATPEMRMRTLFEEGFGIVGGAYGTKFGGALGGLIAISILGLGPLGLFVTVFVCAAVTGAAFYQGSKWLGGRAYDVGDRLSGRIYHSSNELIGALY